MTSSRSISDAADSRSRACGLSRDGLTDARLSVVLEMRGRDRDRFLAALRRPPKPSPELERAALLRASATGEEG